MGAGERFVNESAPYIDVVHSMYAKHREGAAHIPAYFLFDQRFRNKYLFGMFFPILPIRSATTKTATCAGLPRWRRWRARSAWTKPRWTSTVERSTSLPMLAKTWTSGAVKAPTTIIMAIPRLKPNPNLAPLERPPFYVVKMWPGRPGHQGRPGHG